MQLPLDAQFRAGHTDLLGRATGRLPRSSTPLEKVPITGACPWLHWETSQVFPGALATSLSQYCLGIHSPMTPGSGAVLERTSCAARHSGILMFGSTQRLWGWNDIFGSSWVARSASWETCQSLVLWTSGTLGLETSPGHFLWELDLLGGLKTQSIYFILLVLSTPCLISISFWVQGT